jgi:hypothetical protein
VFADAVKLAMGFTLPVVTSIRTVNGSCSAGIGTFVVVNKDGWIVTAAHVFKQFNNLMEAESRTRALEKAKASGAIDTSLPRRDRRAARAKGPTGPAPNDVDKWSVWWGNDSWSVDSYEGLVGADIAVAKLNGFDHTSINNFPVFRDPTKEFLPGTSLCRLGFPFYQLVTKYDQDVGKFELANLPLPIFPNEGILSRMAEMISLDASGNPVPVPFPIRMIETSSAGIRGQSGGPIFDQKGTIWAIQSSTASYEMDLNTKEAQYYHVGIGIHSATIFGLFRTKNIDAQISTY